MSRLSVTKALFRSSSLLGLCLVSSTAWSEATISILIQDGAGEGFNDPAVTTPVGGNNGTTLGQQRLNVFRRAGNIWSTVINSDVEIVINGQFDPQACSMMGSVLGSAGALTIHADFANAPIADTWYSQALANSISGVDLDPATSDINMTFNSDIDTGCSGATGWYYGLDGAAPPDRISLLPVVLHEMGHGLGFQTFTSNSTGAFFAARPDIWTEFLFDLDANVNWRDLPDNAARQASAINDPNLVWIGPNVTAEFPNVLSNPNQLVVDAPGAIAGSFQAQGAAFGPPVPLAGLSGDMTLVIDGAGLDVNDGCEPLSNDLTGQIALINRGNCSFTSKSINAQNAGAIGVVITNNAATGLPPVGGQDPLVVVPTIGITQADGDIIKGALPADTVTVTLNFDMTTFAGTNGGFLRMHAPDPVAPGSSVSHWTTAATPSLLMEPAITPSLFEEVDLTRQLYQDIGWSLDTTSIFSDGFED